MRHSFVPCLLAAALAIGGCGSSNAPDARVTDAQARQVDFIELLRPDDPRFISFADQPADEGAPFTRFNVARGRLFSLPLRSEPFGEITRKEVFDTSAHLEDFGFSQSRGGTFVMLSTTENVIDALELNHYLFSVSGTRATVPFFNEHSLNDLVTQAACGIPAQLQAFLDDLRANGHSEADIARETWAVNIADLGLNVRPVGGDGWVDDRRYRLIWELEFRTPSFGGTGVFDIVLLVGDRTRLALESCAVDQPVTDLPGRTPSRLTGTPVMRFDRSPVLAAARRGMPAARQPLTGTPSDAFMAPLPYRAARLPIR
jgi:hypothetical protein